MVMTPSIPNMSKKVFNGTPPKPPTRADSNTRRLVNTPERPIVEKSFMFS
jgi:hypothetical protein